MGWLVALVTIALYKHNRSQYFIFNIFLFGNIFYIYFFKFYEQIQFFVEKYTPELMLTVDFTLTIVVKLKIQ